MHAHDGYLPIAEHGVIGDLHSVALVGTDGTIDWYCPGRFDAPSVFGSILDAERGGFYRIAPADGGWTTRQLYVPDTNVLITRFLTPDGIGEVLDYLPVDDRQGGHRQTLVRRVLCVRGSMRFRVEVEPRFDYGRAEPEIHVVEGGAVFASPRLTLALSSAVSLERTDGGVHGAFALQADESASFFLEEGERPVPRTEEESRDLFSGTIDYWRRWVAHSTYRGRWREMVMRSALTLKLLTYRPTGALVAAPTTSLPEIVGGERNWDYRYTWIRDASFTIFALLRLGFVEEAGAFGDWLTERFRERAGHGRVRAAPSAIRHRRSQRARGGDARPPRWLSRLRARANRKRRREPAPARHLRRADRLRLPLQQVRTADLA